MRDSRIRSYRPKASFDITEEKEMMIKDTDFIDLPVFIKGKVRKVYDL